MGKNTIVVVLLLLLLVMVAVSGFFFFKITKLNDEISELKDRAEAAETENEALRIYIQTPANRRGNSDSANDDQGGNITPPETDFSSDPSGEDSMEEAFREFDQFNY